MRVEVSNGELILPFYLFVPLFPTLTALYLLAAYSSIVESPADRICLPLQRYHPRKQQQQKKRGIENSLLFSNKVLRITKHPGCSIEPEYTSFDACPDCFRPTVLRNFSTNQFVPLPDHMYLAPRGPHGFFQPRPERQQALVNTLVIVPRGVCLEACPYLLALVPSMSNEKDVRDGIRKTWASSAKTRHWPGQGRLNARIEVVFVISWHQLNKVTYDKTWRLSEWKQLYSEAEVYSDILMLDMAEGYSNLTLKMASAFNWALQHCKRTKFFLKVDQDTFLNVPLLLDLLIYHERRLELSVIGHIYYKSRTVERFGRWGISKANFPMNEYPVFAAGCAYVLSREAARRVITLFPYFPVLGIEDAFITGLLARGAGLQHFSPAHNQFFTEYFHSIRDWCGFLLDQLVTGTGVDTRFRRMNLWSSFIVNDDGQCRNNDMAGSPRTCWEEYPRRAND